ncbi:MAG: ARPP-1 family domain-containing protein [Planctomycetota bacterium]|jgi:hypothetical protein
MNKLLSILWIGVLVASITACVSRERTSQPDVQPTGPNVEALPDDLTLGEYVDVDGARIYALIDKKAPHETIYLTLDEAMAAKVCTVREVGAASQTMGEESQGQEQAVEGDVNKLLITNTGSKPIFLMAGDLVLGGKQDRILGESVVIDANTKDQPIPVFCVEHGRWTTQDKDGDTGKTGYFMNDAETGQVDVSVKKAALGSAQQGEVWESVAKSNAGLGVEGETTSGTFRAAFDSKTIKEKIESNFDRAKDLIGSGVVGFVVYVDGEPVAMDAFDSVELCNKLSEKLLRSYIVSGINGGYEEATGSQSSNNSVGPALIYPDDGPNAEPAPPPPPSPNPAPEGNEGPSFSGETVELNSASRTGSLNTGTRTAAPNTRTSNNSEVTKKAVKYTCKDKKTGKAVQRSFMRR